MLKVDIGKRHLPGASYDNAIERMGQIAAAEPREVAKNTTERVANIRREYGLTVTMRDTLLVIQEWIDLFGHPPTMAELGNELDIAQRGRIATLLRNLEERGYIEKQDFITRGIKVLKRIPFPPEVDSALDALRETR